MIDKIKSGIKISPDAWKIGECAVTGMLYEASTSPKPGLVTPVSAGTHEDMDYFTFLRSTAAISHAMYLCAQVGIDYDTEILNKIRSVGIAAEENMFGATGGINTQKGLLFASGVVCAAAGNIIRNKRRIGNHELSRCCSEICEGIVVRELGNLLYKPRITNGEKLYIKYGVVGIRGEAEKGFPSVINVGLPIYAETLKTGNDKNAALTQCLIGLMTVVEDTVVINRSGFEGLGYMKKEADRALKLGGSLTNEGREQIKKMEREFLNKGISPGGAADLLALTVMIYELEKTKFDMDGVNHE
jgi:triphosphoribosyl-dephospho-CoA synthase